MRRGQAAGPLEGEGERSRDLSQLAHLWRFCRRYRPQIAGALVALAVAAATVLGLGFGLRTLVDDGFASGNAALLDKAVLVLFLVIMLMAGASYARFSLVSWIGERVVADLRKAVYDHLVGLSPAYFEVTRTGEVMSRLTTDTTLLQTVVGTSVSIALRNLLLLVGGAVLLAVTSPRLTGMVFLLVPAVILPILIYGRRVRRLSRESQDRVADLSSHADETLTAIRTVQAFGQETTERSRFAALAEGAFTTAVERIRARAMLTALVILLAFGAVSLVLWIGGHDVLAGRISPGELSAFVFYAVVVAGAVGALSEVIGDLQRAAGATERLIELLNTKSEITAPGAPEILPNPPEGRVAFEGVRFNYPARPDRAAIEDFDLSVEPGERIAIVGPSGAGKTTVFQLLLRFYDPQAGRIRFDGFDLREVEPEALRARIGLVPQEPVIFSADAWENIRFGRPEASDEEVLAAAEAAQALDFLQALPEGLSSFLGQRGVQLSGGQRQRIAIARAVLRNPTLLLLDEATSALDSESERAVQQALERLMVDRTSLVIAHRLATVQKADRIVVMDQGRIVASGRHEELIRADGLYARLATLQFDLDKAEGVASQDAISETRPDLSVVPGKAL